MSRHSVVPIASLDLRFAPRPWRFTDQRRREIDAFFIERQRVKPKLWNGRVLLMHEHELRDGVLRGAYLETDYASFHAWCEWGYPDTGIVDCFACAAILASDGAFVLGVMAAHTANGGRIYFPCGTPDLDDVIEGRVDLEASVRRELEEETGLDIGQLQFDAGWHALFTGPWIVQIKVVRASQPADAVCSRILDNLARQREPELAGLHVVRGPGDFHSQMPGYVTDFLTQWWSVPK